MLHNQKQRTPLDNFTNDATLAFVGYLAGSIFWIIGWYSGRLYIRERLRNEKEIGFSRKQFLKYHRGELLDDYKHMAQYRPEILSDQDIEDLRRLNTDDLQKVRKLREIHEEFSKGDDQFEKATAEEVLRAKIKEEEKKSQYLEEDIDEGEKELPEVERPK